MTDLKLINVDLDALKVEIKNSGLKKKFIASALGYSQQCLYQKLNGKLKFSLREINILCNILKLNKAERDRIFFAENV